MELAEITRAKLVTSFLFQRNSHPWLPGRLSGKTFVLGPTAIMIASSSMSKRGKPWTHCQGYVAKHIANTFEFPLGGNQYSEWRLMCGKATSSASSTLTTKNKSDPVPAAFWQVGADIAKRRGGKSLFSSSSYRQRNLSTRGWSKACVLHLFRYQPMRVQHSFIVPLIFWHGLKSTICHTTTQQSGPLHVNDVCCRWIGNQTNSSSVFDHVLLHGHFCFGPCLVCQVNQNYS